MRTAHIACANLWVNLILSPFIFAIFGMVIHNLVRLSDSSSTQADPTRVVDIVKNPEIVYNDTDTGEQSPSRLHSSSAWNKTEIKRYEFFGNLMGCSYYPNDLINCMKNRPLLRNCTNITQYNASLENKAFLTRCSFEVENRVVLHDEWIFVTRGTDRTVAGTEKTDALFFQIHIEGFHLRSKAHYGFECISREFFQILKDNPITPSIFVGHSLGASISTLLSAKMAKYYDNLHFKAVVYGSPRPFNFHARSEVQNLNNLKIESIQNENDPVVMLPWSFVIQLFDGVFSYSPGLYTHMPYDRAATGDESYPLRYNHCSLDPPLFRQRHCTPQLSFTYVGIAIFEIVIELQNVPIHLNYFNHSILGNDTTLAHKVSSSIQNIEEHILHWYRVITNNNSFSFHPPGYDEMNVCSIISS